MGLSHYLPETALAMVPKEPAWTPNVCCQLPDLASSRDLVLGTPSDISSGDTGVLLLWHTMACLPLDSPHHPNLCCLSSLLSRPHPFVLMSPDGHWTHTPLFSWPLGMPPHWIGHWHLRVKVSKCQSIPLWHPSHFKSSTLLIVVILQTPSQLFSECLWPQSPLPIMKLQKCCPSLRRTLLSHRGQVGPRSHLGQWVGGSGRALQGTAGILVLGAGRQSEYLKYSLSVSNDNQSAKTSHGTWKWELP